MEKPIRVLLVDDEERFVSNLAKLLNGRGFEARTASNGEAAVAAVDGGAPIDVVLLDVRMPGMDGIETLRRIKESAPELEVVMLTGHADVETGIAAMREGALDYLMKPCEIEDLVEKLREAAEVENIRRRPVLWARRRVREITRESFVRLGPEDSLQKALGVFMREPGMAAKDELYVLDAAGRLAGFITRSDLLGAAQKAPEGDENLAWPDLIRHPDRLPSLPIKSLMRGGIPAGADPEAELAATARRMIENNLRCLPVVEDGRMTGIVRLKDVLRHLAQ
jgi:FixJ family two-component response regulator